MVKAFQRRVASHRPEQRQASKCPEPEVVACGDRQHRWRLTQPVHKAICPNGRAEWLVVRATSRGDKHRTLESVREGGATSIMIGQPRGFPSSIGRSTPTASQYAISAFASPGRSSPRSGLILRPIPGRSGTNVR